jgi:hypothetical protein
MEVIIVSKTHMSNAACVGGLVLSNNRYVRLLNPGNYNQPTDTISIHHILKMLLFLQRHLFVELIICQTF